MRVPISKLFSEVEFIDTFDNDGRLTPFPLVKCRNVYVLPG